MQFRSRSIHAIRKSTGRSPLVFWLSVGFAFFAAINTASAQILFQDGFESGNLGFTQNSITWGSSASTQVNSQNPRTGSYSLEFIYPAKVPNSWSEQRFELTNQQLAEIWISYDLYIPTNYFHISSSTGPSNNKFFAIYHDPYTTPGFQVNFSTEPNGSGGSNLEAHYYNNGAEQSPISQPSSQNFITSADTGRWHHMILHVKVPTGATTNDGIMQIWKDGTEIMNITNLASWGGTGTNYIDAGYILGWSNAGYAQQTDFYVDNFIVSTTPLSENPPAAPTAVKVSP